MKLRTVLAWFGALLVVGLYLEAKAVPILVHTTQDVIITITDEPCAQKVVNLPQRAVWKDKRGSWEGCVGVSRIGILVFYFTDGEIVLLPPTVFRPVMGV